MFYIVHAHATKQEYKGKQNSSKLKRCHACLPCFLLKKIFNTTNYSLIKLQENPIQYPLMINET
jgi:hypothetical protein